MRGVSCMYEKVNELLGISMGTWKEDIVRDNFLPFESEEILSISLSSLPLDDVFMWNYEKSGTYIFCQNWLPFYYFLQEFT